MAITKKLDSRGRQIDSKFSFSSRVLSLDPTILIIFVIAYSLITLHFKSVLIGLNVFKVLRRIKGLFVKQNCESHARHRAFFFLDRFSRIREVSRKHVRRSLFLLDFIFFQRCHVHIGFPK